MKCVPFAETFAPVSPFLRCKSRVGDTQVENLIDHFAFAWLCAFFFNRERVSERTRLRPVEWRDLLGR